MRVGTARDPAPLGNVRPAPTAPPVTTPPPPTADAEAALPDLAPGAAGAPANPALGRAGADRTGSYSRERAEELGWNSMTGDFHPERQATVDDNVIGPRVLDAGCGGGAWVGYLTEQGYDAYGVEYHREILGDAGRWGAGSRLCVGDVTRLPYADDSFDTTLCFDVLEHVDDVAALKELARVTRRRIIMAVPRENVLGDMAVTFLTYIDLTHLRYYTFETLEALCRTVCPDAEVDVRGEFQLFGFPFFYNLMKQDAPTRKSTRLQVAERRNGQLLPDTLMHALIELGAMEQENFHHIATNVAAVVTFPDPDGSTPPAAPPRVPADADGRAAEPSGLPQGSHE